MVNPIIVMGEIPTPSAKDMSIGERRDTNVENPIKDLHAGIEIVIARMQNKNLAADAVLVAKAHDTLNQYAKQVREWVVAVIAKGTALQALAKSLEDPRARCAVIASRSRQRQESEQMLTPEGEQELYEALGVLRQGQTVSDIPRLHQELRRVAGESVRVDPHNYIAAFPTNVPGAMLRIRKEHGTKSRSPIIDSVEIYFSGEETLKQVASVTE